MTPDRNDNEPDNGEHGLLDATGSISTTGIDIAGIAHVDVSMPTLGDADDDLVDDDVVPEGTAPLAVDDPAAAAVAGAADSDPVIGDEPVVDAAAEAEAEVEVGTSDVPGVTLRDDATRGDDTQDVATPHDATRFGSGTSVVAASSRSIEPHERVRQRTSEVPLHSRRLGDFEADRESSDLLTADRLLDPAHIVKPDPEGGWQHFVFAITGHRVNLGDGKRARARKELQRRIAAPLSGGPRFVPVLSRKGGVGKTTITTLLGMALADARDDRVIALDANPDRGTLAERVGGSNGKTVRDVVRARERIRGFNDVSQIVARDETRLDILASDTDPHVSEAFSDADYRRVAELAAHYYSVVLTDTGTGIVHDVMAATLDTADQLVVVAGLSVDEARLASETLTWLESNGFADRVRSAIVVLNNARPGAELVRASELETHFRTRVRAVVRMPYDPHIATGSQVSFRELKSETRQAARELAATVVEGLRALTPAP